MSAADAGDGAVPNPPGIAGPEAGPDRRKWMILGVIAVAQLMVVLDGTVVNIALPDAQKALGFGDADRQWIITGYALAFGSLLLLGGKLADLLGRKTTFLVGLIGFAVASAVGGASNGFEMLVTARVCQGAFGALLAPAGLSLLTTTFPGRKERGTAFAVYGAIVASGSALGMLLGGVLTEYLDWRWCLYINLIFAAVGVVGGFRLLEQSRPAVRPKLDLPGTVAISGALFCVVYGFSNAESHAWSTPSTWGFLAAGVVLLAAFAAWQTRAANPLLPLRILADRNRAGAYTAIFLVMTGISGVFLFLTYYLQETRGYSPVATGLAYLPMLTATVATGILSNLRLLPRTGPKPLVIIGLLLAAGGLAWMTTIGLHTGYAASLLGPLVLTGAGMGLALAPSSNTATYRVPASDSGVASAMVNTMQQVGQSVGTALLNTIALSATTGYLTTHAAGTAPSAALQSLSVLHGYTTAFWWAAAILAAGCVISGALIRRGVLAGQGDSGGPGDTPSPQPEPAATAAPGASEVVA
jgi:EmrB/QacA subfamily drug resistance transporter